MPIMPTFFLAHGSPMSAIEDNYFVADWHRIHKDTPKPSAIVVISAHWHVPGTRITANEFPKTIHDFGGFPAELFAQQYPAPGSPALANQLVECLNNKGFAAKTDLSWGLDHGTWALLLHLYPNADIPVLQISMDAFNDDLMHHYRMGEALKHFREQGVLFIGSGNIVHNLRRWFTTRPEDDISWAVNFDKAVAEAIIKRDIDTLANYHSLPQAMTAVPTVEHYLPLMYVMGLSNPDEKVTFSDFGFADLSTASSRSVRFG